MNEKDFFEGVKLLEKECEISGNSLVLNVWHSESDLMMTTLCGSDEDISFALTEILLSAESDVAEKAVKDYLTLKQARDILNRQNKDA